MRQLLWIVGIGGVLMTALAAGQAPTPSAGVALADLAWPDAERVLTPDSVVVIPLGAALLEQGPHLKLNSDERLARYLAPRVQAATAVVIAPVLTFHAYPEFVNYPGSASLRAGTARTMTADLVRSLAAHGPRRFYVLNTAPGALAALSDTATTLADAGILLGYTDPSYRLKRAPVTLRQGALLVSHADEVTTSMMLFADPSAVDMTRAAREYASGSGILTRVEGAPGVFSKSGVLGDATAATREKGQLLVEALLAGALEDIEAVRHAPLPIARPPVPPPAPPAPRPAPAPIQRMASGCTPGEERDLRLIGLRFGGFWRQMDADSIGSMFTRDGDMRHPDGTIEKGADIIRQNRLELFKQKEYRGSSHPVQLNDVRCITPDVAIADGKWELRVADAKPYGGWCTLVLRKTGGGWFIDGWRYTVDPAPNTTPAPTILKKPGWPGGPGGE